MSAVHRQKHFLFSSQLTRIGSLSDENCENKLVNFINYKVVHRPSTIKGKTCE